MFFEYLPRNLDGIKGQDVARLKAYALNKQKKPLLIYGPSGTGKTSSVYALAKELDYEVIEASASCFRDKNSINSVIAQAAGQLSLNQKGKIILIDEIEGFSGHHDRGGINALLDLAETTSFPIIMTANSIEDDKISEIKSKFVLLEYKKLDAQLICNLLIDLCEKDKISYDKQDISKLARLADGDARQAIINLDLASPNASLDKQCIDLISGIARDSIDETLLKVFKSKNLGIVMKSLISLPNDMVDISKRSIRPVLFDKEDCFIYSLEENIPYVYGIKDTKKSFDILSKSDLFHSRIYRWQYYRYLAYIQQMLASVCLSNENCVNMPLIYRKTSRSPKNNKRLWYLMNKRRGIIIKKISACTKTSASKVAKDFEYYKMILRHHPIKELSEGEIEYLYS